MERARILEILTDWNFWEKEQPTGVIREGYLKRLEHLAKSQFVIAVVGPRRSGKSTILMQYIKKIIDNGVNPRDILLVNFEDYRFDEFNLKLLEDIYKLYLEKIHQKGKPFIILDEIHHIPQWERFVRTLYDSKAANIVISGSTAKLMAPELASLLTGRYLQLDVLPLSFREFLAFKGLKVGDEIAAIAQRTKIIKLLQEFMEYGGFPEVVLKETKREILQRYYEDIIMKDVITRYKIRAIAALKTLANFYLTNVSKPVTFGSLKKFLGLSLRTVERFSSYLEAAYLIFLLKKFHPSLKEQEKAPRKVYAVDTGIVNISGFKISENYGKSMENIVFLELKREQFDAPTTEIFYWADQFGREVDFLIKRGPKVTELIQVCYNIEDLQTRERERSSLLRAMELFKVSSGLIITWDFESEEKVGRKRIRYYPLWKWLLKFRP